jgi:hypothetical protein
LGLTHEPSAPRCGGTLAMFSRGARAAAIAARVTAADESDRDRRRSCRDDCCGIATCGPRVHRWWIKRLREELRVGRVGIGAAVHPPASAYHLWVIPTLCYVGMTYIDTDNIVRRPEPRHRSTLQSQGGGGRQPRPTSRRLSISKSCRTTAVFSPIMGLTISRTPVPLRQVDQMSTLLPAAEGLVWLFLRDSSIADA